MEIGIALILLIVLLIIGVPVPFCFCLSIIYLSYSTGINPAFFHRTAYSQLSSVVLLAIPLFIMAGGIMERGQIGGKLVDWVSIFVGRVKGSLGMITVLACTVFSSICGSGAATISCIGSIVAPHMREKNYPLGICAAIVCCCGPIGLVLPPSGIQILYAWTGGLSVLACFLAIVFPGLILSAMLCIGAMLLLRNQEGMIMSDPIPKDKFLSEFGKRTFSAVPALFMPVLILGSIYGGLMTPTEAAATSAFYAIPVAIIIYKQLQFKKLAECLIDTATTTGVIMVMIGMVMVLSTILVRADLHTTLLHILTGVSENPVIIMFMLNVIMILLGAIMDDASSTLLCTPLLLPVARSIGVNPYHFAAVLGLNLGMGNITPPTAPFVFLAARLFNVNVTQTFKPVLFLLLFAYLPTLLITMYVPVLSTYLPSLILGEKVFM